MGEDWNFQDVEKHFFVYLERVDNTDWLAPLNLAPLPERTTPDRLLKVLYENLRNSAHAATVPYFTALHGAFEGRSRATRTLIEAAKQGQRELIAAAVTILDDHKSSIDGSFAVFKALHEKGYLDGAIRSLLGQTAANIWGVFETFTLDLLMELLRADLKFLREIAQVARKGVPWGLKPAELLRSIEQQLLADPALSVADAVQPLSDTSINLNAARHFFGAIFQAHPDVAAALGAQELTVLSARRHLLMHRAGIVDAKYQAESGDTSPLGTGITITPSDLVSYFKAVVRAGAALKDAANQRL